MEKKMKTNNGSSAPAPTGCYKCGRAGHWSRDCTFPPTTSKPPNFPSSAAGGGKQQQQQEGIQSTEVPKVKKPPRSRPKLTPDLLLSNDGLGYVLEHIPRMLHFRGPGHEVQSPSPLLLFGFHLHHVLDSFITIGLLLGFHLHYIPCFFCCGWIHFSWQVSDLGNLIEAFIQWHSRLLPSVSFQYFVDRVEKVGATKRVRNCLRELRERVARGENPKTLHDPPVEPTSPVDDVMVDGDVGSEDPNKDVADDDIQEDLFDELYRHAVGENPISSSQKGSANEVGSLSFSQSPILNTTPEEQGWQQSQNEVNEQGKSQSQITEEQKARMEENRLKALERAAARASQLQAQ
eukprot:PITA_02424